MIERRCVGRALDCADWASASCWSCWALLSRAGPPCSPAMVRPWVLLDDEADSPVRLTTPRLRVERPAPCTATPPRALPPSVERGFSGAGTGARMFSDRPMPLPRPPGNRPWACHTLLGDLARLHLHVVGFGTHLWFDFWRNCALAGIDWRLVQLWRFVGYLCQKVTVDT